MQQQHPPQKKSRKPRKKEEIATQVSISHNLKEGVDGKKWLNISVNVPKDVGFVNTSFVQGRGLYAIIVPVGPVAFRRQFDQVSIQQNMADIFSYN